MLYRFGEFELDIAAMELRCEGAIVGLEPQVFALLALLVDNRERVVGKEEIIERIWDGRVVSDSALSSRIKSLRQALGDDGKAQRVVRTVHGRGFRFVAELKTTTTAVVVAEVAQTELIVPSAHAEQGNQKPSLAVLPFQAIGEMERYGVLADALPHELISSLSRLRWLSVIARGSSFKFRENAHDMTEVGRALNVRYCMTGAIEIYGEKISITVELADTSDSHLIWAERYDARLSDVHEIRHEILTSVVSALELQIPLHEAAIARLTAPESLDAWSLYHLGLQHMYRFNRGDNEIATGLFEQAIAQAPDFARAFAGLSFTHFQSAFLKYNDSADAETNLARNYADRALELDPLDPFSNYVMGRSYWLAGELDAGLGWLERSTTLSPSFAQGLYARGWTDTLAGRGSEGRESVDSAMRLSPFDPLLYAMRATKALSYIVGSDDLSASHWAEQAARCPGAHPLIAMIAVGAHTLSGEAEKATYWASNIRDRRPDLTRVHFFQSFPFADESIRARMDRALLQHGF